MIGVTILEKIPDQYLQIIRPSGLPFKEQIKRELAELAAKMQGNKNYLPYFGFSSCSDAPFFTFNFISIYDERYLIHTYVNVGGNKREWTFLMPTDSSKALWNIVNSVYNETLNLGTEKLASKLNAQKQQYSLDEVAIKLARYTEEDYKIFGFKYLGGSQVPLRNNSTGK